MEKASSLYNQCLLRMYEQSVEEKNLWATRNDKKEGDKVLWSGWLVCLGKTFLMDMRFRIERLAILILMVPVITAETLLFPLVLLPLPLHALAPNRLTNFFKDYTNLFFQHVNLFQEVLTAFVSPGTKPPLTVNANALVLAKMYRKGQGVAKNEAQAFNLYSSVSSHCQEAAYRAAKMKSTGEGTKRSVTGAIKLLNINGSSHPKSLYLSGTLCYTKVTVESFRNQGMAKLEEFVKESFDIAPLRDKCISAMICLAQMRKWSDKTEVVKQGVQVLKAIAKQKRDHSLRANRLLALYYRGKSTIRGHVKALKCYENVLANRFKDSKPNYYNEFDYTKEANKNKAQIFNDLKAHFSK